MKKLITITIIIIPIIAFIIYWLLTVLPQRLAYSKFEEIFNDTSILTKGYTNNGLTRLTIYPETFKIRYTTYDTKDSMGYDVEFEGKAKVKDSNTLLLTYDDGSITCSVLQINVLDCDGAVFRRYDGEYLDEQECKLDEVEYETALDAGWDDAYDDRQGANYNNPYDKIDPCYQAYDEAYSNGVYNGYLRRANAERAFESARNGNACLGLGGQCYNPRR